MGPLIAYMNFMKRQILIHPDPRLKKVCAAVPDLSDELRVLADDMLETMYAAPASAWRRRRSALCSG